MELDSNSISSGELKGRSSSKQEKVVTSQLVAGPSSAISATEITTMMKSHASLVKKIVETEDEETSSDLSVADEVELPFFREQNLSYCANSKGMMVPQGTKTIES